MGKKYNVYQLNLRDIGLPDRRVKISEELVTKMKNLRDKGWSYKRIADELGTNYGTVYRKLNPKYYKHLCKYNYQWSKKHRSTEQMSLNSKRFYTYKKNLLNSIDCSKYLDKRPERQTRKVTLMKLMEEGKNYTYNDLCKLLKVKAPSYFYRHIQQLKQEGKVVIENGLIRKVKL